MKEKITRRYLAGLLDGEGYFGILPATGNNRIAANGLKQFRPTIKMALTTPEVIKEICLKLGGHIHMRKFEHDIWNAAWCWESRTFVQVEKVLNYVHEYLIIKKPQADILREFIDTKFKLSSDMGSTPIPKETLEKREHLYYLMRKLNHRGKALAETKRDDSKKLDEVIVQPSEKSEDAERNLCAVAV